MVFGGKCLPIGCIIYPVDCRWVIKLDKRLCYGEFVALGGCQLSSEAINGHLLEDIACRGNRTLAIENLVTFRLAALKILCPPIRANPCRPVDPDRAWEVDDGLI